MSKETRIYIPTRILSQVRISIRGKAVDPILAMMKILTPEVRRQKSGVQRRPSPWNASPQTVSLLRVLVASCKPTCLCTHPYNRTRPSLLRLRPPKVHNESSYLKTRRENCLHRLPLRYHLLSMPRPRHPYLQ